MKPGRWSLIALLLAAIVLQIVGLFIVPWFHFDLEGQTIAISGASMDAWGLDSDLAFTIGGAALRLASLYFAIRLAVTIYTLAADRPVNRWLAFATPGRALGQAAMFTVLAIVVAAFLRPELALEKFEITFPVIRDHGCDFVVAGIAVGGLALVLLRKNPELVTLMGWVREVEATPARRERPMTQGPLPSPPMIEGDPFRAPPQGHALRLVETAPPPKPPPLIADEAAPAPKLLR